MNENDIEAIASWENDCEDWDELTGPRHDSATCYECGRDADNGPTLDGHTFCSRACLDAWVRR